MADRTEIRANPRTDLEFASLADALAETATDADELQARLRLTYPNAVVRPRGLSGEPTVVWYVYRDGRWIDP